jgi:8-oxo-dGTP diphosphatase
VEPKPSAPTAESGLRLQFALTVDIVLVTVRQGRLSVLMVERGGEPYAGHWALPGGFVDPDEDTEDAAMRELSEETGLDHLPEGIHLEQLRTYGRPGRDPRGRTVSVAYLALVPDLPSVKGGDDAAQARFWPIEDLVADDAPRLAFDHDEILRDGVERARAKLEYTTVALAFVQEPFTFADLRRVYEAVWGVQLDHSNFRKKVIDNEGFVEPIGREAPRLKGGPGGRPADLYRRGPAFWLERAIIRPRFG